MLKSIGLYFRKIDFLNFAVGAIMPIIVLFIVYSSVKSNIILQDTDFLSLLMNHKGKFYMEYLPMKCFTLQRVFGCPQDFIGYGIIQ